MRASSSSRSRMRLSRSSYNSSCPYFHNDSELFQKILKNTFTENIENVFFKKTKKLYSSLGVTFSFSSFSNSIFHLSLISRMRIAVSSSSLNLSELSRISRNMRSVMASLIHLSVTFNSWYEFEGGMNQRVRSNLLPPPPSPSFIRSPPVIAQIIQKLCFTSCHNCFHSKLRLRHKKFPGNSSEKLANLECQCDLLYRVSRLHLALLQHLSTSHGLIYYQICKPL